MLEYYVTYEFALNDLIEAVNRLLADGWRTEGGVFVRNAGDEECCYYQSLVRVVPDPEAE